MSSFDLASMMQKILRSNQPASLPTGPPTPVRDDSTRQTDREKTTITFSEADLVGGSPQLGL